MSDERKTSHAKDVELTSYQKTAIDRAAAIRERYNSNSRGNLARFNEASGADKTDPGALDAPIDQTDRGPGGGSQQVKAQASEPHLRPSGPIRNAVDAQHHRGEMAKDDRNSTLRNQALERMQRAKDAEQARNVLNSKDGNEKD